jgi:uracil-DNA glycosylase
MLPSIPTGWKSLLDTAASTSNYQNLDRFLDQELAAGKRVLPAQSEIYKALELTPYEQVKVLLVGQDPYPTPGYAHGLCFSVKPDVRPLPASLKNVYKELHDDVGFRIPNHGCLEAWARQGMLMLNTLLTLEAGIPNSHQGKGWEKFTDRIIELIAAKPTRVVFLLWGASAQKKGALVKQPQHKVINCAHPSPLSAKMFFGCRCFSKTNQRLEEAGLPPIDWQIADV